MVWAPRKRRTQSNREVTSSLSSNLSLVPGKFHRYPPYPLKMSVAEASDPDVDPIAYLRSINAVRERSRLVLQKAHANQLNHFDVDLNKFSSTANYVVSIIKVSTFRIPQGCGQNSLSWSAYAQGGVTALEKTMLIQRNLAPA